mmetsp:Transcript_43400/g.122791  ORF Transcript_43400/g.122791 Transcript_43400/m.122791 type:complete len:253 (-) Transcript_43400:836-1594(-)
MEPYGSATACGVLTPFGSFGASFARLRLFEPTFFESISSGVTHQAHLRSSLRFIFTVFPPLVGSSSSAKYRLGLRESFRIRSALALSGRTAFSTVTVPSCPQLTCTHSPTSVASICSVIAGSKHVAKRTPEFRARTAQCERMSGAEAASRTSTAWTPAGTSSSPLTAPLRRIVGVSKILSCMWSMRGTEISSPHRGRSTAAIICHGGRCAMARSCGSSLLSTRLTEKSALARSTSSTKTSSTCFGAPIASPR